MIWSGDKRYYGSTIQNLSMRMCGHRAKMKSWNAGKNNYCTSFEVLRHADAKIEWIETVEFTDRAELSAREGWFIRNNLCVNKYVAGRGQSEYHATYRATHKKEIAATDAAYRVDHKEEIAATRAVYYTDHKEEIAAAHAVYRASNKEAIDLREAVRKSAKVVCLCGVTHRRGDSARHAKTKGHIAHLALGA